MSSAIVVYEDSHVAATGGRRPIRFCEAEQFSQKGRDHQRYSKAERRYYKNQAALLRAYKEDRDHLTAFLRRPPPPDAASVIATKSPCEKEAVLQNVSFACNFLLLVVKVIATIRSGSLSILSSMVDSLVDNTTNVVIALSTWAIRTRDPIDYPRGRTRLEPLGLIIISVIMGIASLQVIVQTVQAVINNAVRPIIFVEVNGTVTDELEWQVMGIMISTIVVKLCLCITCYVLGRGSPTVTVLAQDHRNDCLSNAVAISCGLLAHKYWRYIDSIGAILISVYVASSWVVTGYKQISILSGRSAPPYFISRIIKICMDHHPEILHVDAVTVYHFGTQFIVEVDIVVDENMTIRHAHGISDPLQRKLEHLPDVERAFVHVEYQTKHTASTEHKTV